MDTPPCEMQMGFDSTTHAFKLDLALQAADMGAWELDLVNEKRHFDARVCGLLGIDPATFRGTTEEFYRAVHPDDREGLRAALDRTIDEGTVYAVEYRAVWPNGSVHWLSARGMRLHDAAGRPTAISGMLWDITARKQADATLRESEDRFRHLFEHSTIGMAITQLTGEITVNRAYCAMLGYDLGALDKTLLRAITHPDDTALTAREFGAVLAGEKPFARFEKRYLNKNGPLVWVDMVITLRRDVAGKPLYVITSVVDITERKLAEQANLEKMDELRRWHEVTLGRETRVIELKQEVNELLSKLGQPVRYTSAEAREPNE